MVNRRVVITGLGIIGPNGIGKSAFSEAILSGVSGIRPISLFDASGYKVKMAGEVKDFDPKEFLGQKGLRTLDRSTKLVASAAKLALDEARLIISEENTHKVGVSIGTTFGSLSSICGFDRESIKEGPHYVNPALFPNTVINSPASQVSIKFGIKGFNTTISTGSCASLDAINYAADFLKFGRADIVLAGGVEEFCQEIFLGFYKTGLLSGLDGGKELVCPFDRRRNGVILGEGASVLVLETLESALGRGARILAEVRGYGTAFAGHRVDKYRLSGAGLKRAMRQAVQKSGMEFPEIDCVSCSANSTLEADLIEAQVIKEVFGEFAGKVNVTAIKSMIGECFSASGSFQAAAAVVSIEKQMVPPTINSLEPDESCQLNYSPLKALSVEVDNVMINTFGTSGHNSSLVISKFNA